MNGSKKKKMKLITLKIIYRR